MNIWLKVGLGIFFGGSLVIFVAWLILMSSGEPQKAEEVRNIPNQIEDAKSQAQDKALGGIGKAISQVNEDRKQAVAREQDPNQKNLINIIYMIPIIMLIWVAIVIILIFLGIDPKSIKIG